MNLRPYPEYKECPSPLLGDIPNHWDVSRLRSALSIKKEIVGDSWSNHLLLSLTLRGVIPRDMENIVGKLPADFTTYQRVHRDDLVFCLFDVEETPRTVGWVPEAGMLTGAYTAASPNPAFESKYLAYHYLSYDQHKSLRGYYAGLRNTIRSADFANIPICFPPLEEQRTIVEYLDREITEIDAFIRDQEELIALLGERHTATITQAVSKGMNPDTPMKDSGVQWFGQVPSHWQVLPLKRQLVRIEQGVSPEASSEYADEDSVGVLKAGCVNGGNFRETEHKRLPDDFKFDQKLLVSCGDLLVNRASGSVNLVGSAAIVKSLTYKLILSDKIFRLRTQKNIVPQFVEKFLNSSIYREQVRGAISGAEGLANNLPSTSLRRFLVPLPPVEEQREIVAYLNKEIAKIDAAIADAREAIALSKERRAAVISAAVTGKIDVRDLMVPASTTKMRAESVGVA